MGASTADLLRFALPTDNPIDNALWHHDAPTWIADCILLAVLAFALVIVTNLLLRRLDPQRVRS